MSSDDFSERSADRFRADVDAGASASDAGATGAAVAEPAGSDGGAMPDEPIGTLFFMIVFILLLVGLWGTVFWMLLNR